MGSRRWLLLSAHACGLVAVACNQLAGIEKGTPGELCSEVGDCRARVSDCRAAAACAEGLCVYRDAAAGTEPSDQPPGDCARAVCDGQGQIALVADPDDVHDDGNPCTRDFCEATNPRSVPWRSQVMEYSVYCYTGPPGTLVNGSSCKLGSQRCDWTGHPLGPCEGEVLPAEEVCGAELVDEDCDGVANEAASCLTPLDDLVAGGAHTCAVLVDTRMKCWGANDVGQLGQGDSSVRGDEPGELGDALSAVDLGRDTPMLVALGWHHSCAVLAGGSVACWGDDWYGQLGVGGTKGRGDAPAEMGEALVPIDLGVEQGATAIAAGWSHACVVLRDGAVKCWGNNEHGQLGLGDVDDRGDDPGEMGEGLATVDLGAGSQVTAITAGRQHTCALLEGGSVKCWGHNAFGQLGQGDDSARGDDLGEMGDNLPPVDLGAGKKAVSVVAGANHTCVLLEGGAVKCWGASGAGQLGLGSIDGRGDEPWEMGDELLAVDLGAKAANAIAAGEEHVCALLDGGAVKCWGANSKGQLGLGDTQARGDEPGEMGDILPAVALGTGVLAVAITCGFEHACARTGDGLARCWGANWAGQLGQGDTEDRGDEQGEMGDALKAVAP